jgi:uncharacterized protein (DUF924 family)
LASDLGGAGPEVHAQAREVLDFWFSQPPERWFAKSASLDREIATRFAALRQEVLSSGATGWRDDPETLLAAIVLLDQFSRNIHRGTARAFEADPLARELAEVAVERAWDLGMAPERRLFLYLPFEHAEDAAQQARSVRLFEALGNAAWLDFARAHAGVIARFGRFPGRNAALGRTSTSEEEEHLRQPGTGW